MAGIYANFFAVNVGNYPYPGVAVLVGAAFLIPHMTPHTRSLKWMSLIFLGFLVFLSFATGGRDVNDTDGRLTSLLQIIAAVGCAHVLLSAMAYPPKTVRKKTLFFLDDFFIVVGVILESTFSPVRDLSDAFRHAAFEGRFIYEKNDARDIQQYGFCAAQTVYPRTCARSHGIYDVRAGLVRPVLVPQAICASSDMHYPRRAFFWEAQLCC